MLRRIPILPMLFGAFSALALLSVLAIAEPAVNDVHILSAGAAVGAAYVLLLYAASPLLRGEPRSTTRAIGRGCLYAMGGYFTLIIVVFVVAVAAQRNVEITGYRLFAALDETGAAHDDDWTAVLIEAR